MGSSSERHDELAAPLGRWLAESGYDLLTGGGGGVMAAVSEAFSKVEGRPGIVIGVVPGTIDDQGRYVAYPEYPNQWVEVAIRTHLPLRGARGSEPMSRNHINVLSSDVVIALPGSEGTLSEIELALRYGKPVAAFVGAGAVFPGLPDGVPRLRDLVAVEEFIEAALE